MSPASDDRVLHLVRRATWGPTASVLADVRQQGAGRWLSSQLAPASIDDSACDALVARFSLLRRSIAQVRASDTNGSWDTMTALGRATLGRYVWSRRQLFEVMCDFWSNHLNVACPSSDVWADRHDYDATVIRAHALGSFSQMLLAAARHPSMLRYLDGASSTKSAPNQNYGRELMELHTVGVDAGYGEAGVVAAARVLTGATLTKDGTYAYDARRHDAGAATVLGWSAPAHSPADGEAVQASFLSYLATHPATATHLATKLCLRFVSDTPPPRLVASLAATYLASGTQIVPVLQALFASPEFTSSAGAKTRRPPGGVRRAGAGHRRPARPGRLRGHRGPVLDGARPRPRTSGLGTAERLPRRRRRLGVRRRHDAPLERHREPGEPLVAEEPHLRRPRDAAALSPAGDLRAAPGRPGDHGAVPGPDPHRVGRAAGVLRQAGRQPPRRQGRVGHLARRRADQRAPDAPGHMER